MTSPPPCPPGRRRGRAVVALLAVLALPLSLASGLAVARPSAAHAGGLAFGAAIVQERALLSLADGREQIVLSLGLEPSGADGTQSGSGDRPGLVFPVPATPTVEAVPAAQDGVFASLARATAPLPVDQDGTPDRSAADRADAAVEVLSRAAVGGYEVTRLRATRGDALQRWLDRNGYATPPAAVPVLRDYVARGWAFVALRLARTPTTTVALRPLRISFPSRRLVYPLRLNAAAGRPVSVELYVSGPHRVVAKGFDTFHAEPQARLRPPLPVAERPLLRGPFLTKLGIVRKRADAVPADVVVRQAVSDRLFRATADYPFESEAAFATAPLPSDLERPSGPPDGTPSSAAWLLLFPAVAILVGALLLVLRLRDRLRRR